MFDYWQGAYSLAITGDTIFVATDGTGLEVLNINGNRFSKEGQLEGGYPFKVKIEGEYAYVLQWSTLQITDLEAIPNTIGTLETQRGTEIDVEGNLAVIGSLRGGLMFVDVSDPSQPEIVSTLDIDENPHGVTINGSYVFASYPDGGVYIINIDDINEPEITTQIDDYGLVNNVVIEGDLAILSTEDSGLILIDISDFQEPREISSIIPREGRPCKKTVIRNDFAYTLGWDLIHTVDIQDVENPEVVGRRFGFSPSSDFEIEGNRLVMTLSEDWGNDWYLSAVGVYLYNIEDPVRPSLVDRYISIGYAYDVVIRDDFLFLLEGCDWEAYSVDGDDIFAELKIINVENPMEPRYVSSYPGWLGDVSDVDMVGNFVYFAAGYGGLEILDLSNPQRPRGVGLLDIECLTVTVNETHAFISPSSDWRNETNLFVVDISDPTDPTEIAEINTEATIEDMMNVNDFVYIANYNLGLTVIDVTDPENPEETANLQGYRTYKIDVQGDVLFILCEGGLWIVDISDPTNPNEITFLRIEGSLRGVDVQGDFAAVVRTNPSSLLVVDISDSANPEVTGSYSEDIRFSGVALIEEYAYAACRSHLNIYDCSGAMGLPVPPEWVNVPRVVIVTETDTIEFELVAIDSNGDEIVLEMDRRNLPDEAVFTDDGEGRGRFRWVTGYDDADNYDPRFRASAGEDESTIEVNIRVLNLNRPPELIGRIPDIVHTEDGGRLEISHLDTIFSDPDEEQLQFIFLNAPEPMNISVDRNDELALNPDQNYNLPEGAEIILICQDGEVGEVSDSFNVIIEPVNDAPSRFGILQPQDGTVIEGNEATFTWQETSDIDSDSVGYCLNLNVRHNTIDTSFSWAAGTDTSKLISELDTISAGLGIWEQITALWHVEASDGSLTTESFNRYEIVIPFTQVADDQQKELPDHYSLGLNYPNPFNNSTTIPFSLPVSGQVILNVYDIYGRFQDTIINESIPTGCHQAIWNADSFPAGIYFYMLTAGDYIMTCKMVLVK